MELYNKDELNTLKDFIEITKKEDIFKDTLESINNCFELLENDNLAKENSKLESNNTNNNKV